jgi:hypothetical protein
MAHGPIQQIEEQDMEEALTAFSDFRKVQTGGREEEMEKRLSAGEPPAQVIEEVMGDFDPADMAASLRRLREAVGLTDDATRALWKGLTDLGIDHDVRATETAAFIALFLGVRASQAATTRLAATQ